MPNHIKTLAAIIAAAFAVAGLGNVTTASAGTASPGTSASDSSTLISVPVAQVCHYRRFTIGVGSARGWPCFVAARRQFTAAANGADESANGGRS